MRGAHSCGVLMALVHQELTDFDVVAATSAGACTSAFFVSRQFDLLPRLWTRYLHDGRFINLKKLGTRQSVMDLDYLIHDVFRNLEPLDVEALQKSRTRFFMPATDCETGEAHFFSNQEDPILNSLKASAALPIAYRQPVVIAGRSYVDGGIAAPIPIQKAIEEECEEVLLVLTGPKGYRKKAPLVPLLPKLYQKKYPMLASAISHRHLVYNEMMERIENGDWPCRLKIIRPLEKLPVRRLTSDREKILSAVEQGYREALQILSDERSSEQFD